MVKSYGKSDNTVALEFASYRLYSNQPYVSDTHGGRLVMNYANETGKAYGAYENAGTFPSGSKLAKPSFMVKGNGRAALGPLFIMEKMAAGFNADSDDWRYVMIMPNGSIFGTTNGKGSDKVEFCIGCRVFGPACRATTNDTYSLYGPTLSSSVGRVGPFLCRHPAPGARRFRRWAPGI
jgi:hypothetical protein